MYCIPIRAPAHASCKRFSFKHGHRHALCISPTQQWTHKELARQGSHMPRAIEDSNLGQLSQFAVNSAQEDLSWAVQRVSPESFANRGLYIDTPVVLASGFLFILLLAVSFQRVLGLDKMVADLMLKWRDDKRRENLESRQRLERIWNADDAKGGSESDNT